MLNSSDTLLILVLVFLTIIFVVLKTKKDFVINVVTAKPNKAFLLFLLAYSSLIIIIFKATPASNCFTIGYSSCEGLVANLIAFTMYPGLVALPLSMMLVNGNGLISAVLFVVLNSIGWFLIIKLLYLVSRFVIRRL